MPPPPRATLGLFIHLFIYYLLFIFSHSSAILRPFPAIFWHKLGLFCLQLLLRRRPWWVTNDAFCIENDKLCIKTEDFCIENDEFCRPPAAGDEQRQPARRRRMYIKMKILQQKNQDFSLKKWWRFVTGGAPGHLLGGILCCLHCHSFAILLHWHSMLGFLWLY